MLTAWDGTRSKDSAAAALYAIWLPRLTRAVAQAVPVPADRAPAADRVSADRLLALLASAGLISEPVVDTSWVDGSPRPEYRREPGRDGPDPLAPALVRALTGPALAEAWNEASSRMGADPEQWAWGRIHQAAFEHPLAFTPARRELMSLAPVARGGDATTPNATGAGGRQTAGASYREVLDVGDWDRSVTINVPGISGQPGSPHYGDLLPLWAAGQYHPMLFTRKAVENAAASRLWLLPAPARPRQAPAREAGGPR